MSAYQVSNDHIAALVDIGRIFNITNVYQSHQRLWSGDLNNSDEDRRALALLLWKENTLSLQTKYGYEPELRDTFPVFARKLSWLQFHDPISCAVALRWIACYCYQACEHAGFDTSVSSNYCQALRSALTDQLCELTLRKRNVWDYNSGDLAGIDSFVQPNP
jgi:hypothetical protein